MLAFNFQQGPNKNPVRAGIVMMCIAIVFVLIGDLNKLAILSTMPFMITYAFVNYSYASLAMSYDLQSVNSIELEFRYEFNHTNFALNIIISD